jgi:hypothetical protein
MNVKLSGIKRHLFVEWNHDFSFCVDHLTVHARDIKPVPHVQEEGDHIMPYDYFLRNLHPESLTVLAEPRK